MKAIAVSLRGALWDGIDVPTFHRYRDQIVLSVQYTLQLPLGQEVTVTILEFFMPSSSVVTTNNISTTNSYFIRAVYNLCELYQYVCIRSNDTRLFFSVYDLCEFFFEKVGKPTDFIRNQSVQMLSSSKHLEQKSIYKISR